VTDFARELFNLGYQLSKEQAMNIGDRGPAPSFYDPPKEPETIEHWLCEGSGKAGCTSYCNNSDYERQLCKREHICLMCGGTGRIPYSKQDAQDDKANER